MTILGNINILQQGTRVIYRTVAYINTKEPHKININEYFDFYTKVTSIPNFIHGAGVAGGGRGKHKIPTKTLILL